MGDTSKAKLYFQTLGHEVAVLQGWADMMVLPDDVAGLITTWMQAAESLPDGSEQKPLMLKELRVARNALQSGDEKLMRLCLYRARIDWDNAVHDTWVDGVERQFGRNAATRRAAAEKWRAGCIKITLSLPPKPERTLRQESEKVAEQWNKANPQHPVKAETIRTYLRTLRKQNNGELPIIPTTE